MNKERHGVIAWWLYDWANSAFILIVVTAFFPVLFKSFWCADVDPTISTARLGIGNAIAGFIVALFSPFLGAIADISYGKKRMLFIFMMIGVLSTLVIPLLPAREWFFALFFFLIALIGFHASNIFYDALLVNVAEKKMMDWVSSVGYGVGYVGSGLLFIVCVIIANHPATFGLSGMEAAIKLAFILAAAWWLVFTLPLVFIVKEENKIASLKKGTKLYQNLSQVASTAAAILKNRRIVYFLLAYWLYIDGVHTFILMAIDFGMAIGLQPSSLMVALIIVQFVGVPSTILFGLLAKRFGAGTMILIGILVYLFTCSVGSFHLNTKNDFIILACLIAFAQGGIQALSRSVFGKMIPHGHAAEYFGFFNIVSRFAVILGPMGVGGVAIFAKKAGFTSITASRLGMSSVSLLFIAGGILLICMLKIGVNVDDR